MKYRLLISIIVFSNLSLAQVGGGTMPAEMASSQIDNIEYLLIKEQNSHEVNIQKLEESLVFSNLVSKAVQNAFMRELNSLSGVILPENIKKIGEGILNQASTFNLKDLSTKDNPSIKVDGGDIIIDGKVILSL